jgi:hypothetical protein
VTKNDLIELLNDDFTRECRAIYAHAVFAERLKGIDNATFSIRSSKVPQAGAVGALGLVPGPGDVLFKFNTTIQNFEGYSYDEFSLTWGPSEPTVDVAEAFFYNNASTTATWVRNFTIP